MQGIHDFISSPENRDEPRPDPTYRQLETRHLVKLVLPECTLVNMNPRSDQTGGTVQRNEKKGPWRSGSHCTHSSGAWLVSSPFKSGFTCRRSLQFAPRTSERGRPVMCGREKWALSYPSGPSSRLLYHFCMDLGGRKWPRRPLSTTMNGFVPVWVTTPTKCILKKKRDKPAWSGNHFPH